MYIICLVWHQCLKCSCGLLESRRPLRHNWYSSHVICAHVPKQRSQTQKDNPAGTAVIPYQAVSNKISMFLTKYSIKTIYIPIHMLRPMRDKLGPKVWGMYCVQCKNSKVYVYRWAEPSRPPVRNVWNTHTWASHRNSLLQMTDLKQDPMMTSNTFILVKVTGYVDRLINDVLKSSFTPEALPGTVLVAGD